MSLFTRIRQWWRKHQPPELSDTEARTRDEDTRRDEIAAQPVIGVPPLQPVRETLDAFNRAATARDRAAQFGRIYESREQAATRRARRVWDDRAAPAPPPVVIDRSTPLVDALLIHALLDSGVPVHDPPPDPPAVHDIDLSPDPGPACDATPDTSSDASSYDSPCDSGDSGSYDSGGSDSGGGGDF